MPIISSKQIKVLSDVTIENGYYTDMFSFFFVEDTHTRIVRLWNDNSTMLEIKSNTDITVGDWLPSTREAYDEACVRARDIIEKVL